MPLPRFRIRTVMIAVAVVAITLYATVEIRHYIMFKSICTRKAYGNHNERVWWSKFAAEQRRCELEYRRSAELYK